MKRTRKINLPKLLLLVVLLLEASGGATLPAQDVSGPYFPAPQILPVPETMPAERPAYSVEKAAPAPVGEDHASAPAVPDGHWFVSSRRLPQSGEPRSTAAELDYYRVDRQCRMHASSTAEFQSRLDPCVPVCIVVHGSYTTWRNLVRESSSVARWLRSTAPGQPLQVVFYSWPSDPITAILPGVDIGIFGQRASFNGFYLAQLVQQMPDGSRISFFAHSHGARVTSSALHLLDGGQLRGYQLRSPGRGRRSLRPIFAAAAIDHHWLNPGERFAGALNQIDHGLVLHNRRDLALMIYPLRRLFSHRPLGLVGFDRLDRRMQNGRALKLAEVDVTPLIDTGHLWTHYFKQPAIAEKMRPYLFFPQNEPELAAQPGTPASCVMWSSSKQAKNQPTVDALK